MVLNTHLKTICIALPLLMAPASVIHAQSTLPEDLLVETSDDQLEATDEMIVNAETHDPALLKPLPPEGIVPPIVNYQYSDFMTHAFSNRARIRDYERQLKTIRYKHFRNMRVEAIRGKGLDLIREFTDPASYGLMIEVFSREKDDVRLAMLDHFAHQDESGQDVLAWIAIHHDDSAMRHEATKRLGDDASDPVLQQLDLALRSDDHEVVANAAILASSLSAYKAIPLLIFGQAAGGPAPRGTGDLAWISIETQRAYVAGVIPIVGNAAGAFVPIIDTIHEGTLMRVVDAVVIFYRTEVHRVLVAMTSAEMEQSTAHLNYDIDAWWHWYNEEYVPFKNEQIMIDALAEE
ncbi:MAG: hypothetical protein O7G85_16725 [Planctomycetota bacterium]|nr:hypothetical protein [Planctomycetota bacterium]